MDSIPNQVCGLKDGKEVLKICVSALDSAFKGLFLNLRKTSKKGGRPQEHVCFLTRQGVGRNIVPAHVTGRDAEDVRKCLEISMLELS